jgi:hypothetical protein
VRCLLVRSRGKLAFPGGALGSPLPEDIQYKRTYILLYSYVGMSALFRTAFFLKIDVPTDALDCSVLALAHVDGVVGGRPKTSFAVPDIYCTVL